MTSLEYLIVQPTLDKGRGVFTTRDWSIGEIVISARVTEVSPVRTNHSFQTAANTHAEFDEPARLVNHSCEPNLGIRDNDFQAFDFVALRPIKLGEELTWDYATSEYESIAVPLCRCHSPACRGTVLGYKHLTDGERKRLTHIANYLRTMPL